MICKNCNAYNADDSKFCHNCGAPLAAAAPESKPEPQNTQHISDESVKSAPAPEVKPSEFVGPGPNFANRNNGNPPPAFGGGQNPNPGSSTPVPTPAPTPFNNPPTGSSHGSENSGTSNVFTPGSVNEDPGRNFAIASLVLGIVSFFCCGFVCGILAIIFGFVAKNKGSKSPMATAGIVCGFIAIAIMIIVAIFSFATSYSYMY